jgi:hypothetical protein
MEEMQLGDTRKLKGVGKDNMCIVDEPCVLQARRWGWKSGCVGIWKWSQSSKLNETLEKKSDICKLELRMYYIDVGGSIEDFNRVIRKLAIGLVYCISKDIFEVSHILCN